MATPQASGQASGVAVGATPHGNGGTSISDGMQVSATRAHAASGPQHPNPMLELVRLPLVLTLGMIQSAFSSVVLAYRNAVREIKLLRRLTVRLVTILARTSLWMVMLARLLLFTMCLLPNWLYLLYVYFISGRVIRAVRYGPHARNFVDIYMPHELASRHRRQPISPPPPVNLSRVKHFPGQFARLSDAFSFEPTSPKASGSAVTSSPPSTAAPSLTIPPATNPVAENKSSESNQCAPPVTPIKSRPTQSVPYPANLVISVGADSVQILPATPASSTKKQVHRRLKDDMQWLARDSQRSPTVAKSTTTSESSSPPAQPGKGVSSTSGSPKNTRTNSRHLAPSEITLRRRIANAMGLEVPHLEQATREQQHPGRPVVVFVTGGAWTIGFRMWGALLGHALTAPIRSLFRPPTRESRSETRKPTMTWLPSFLRVPLLWVAYVWQSPFVSPIRSALLMLATVIMSALMLVVRQTARLVFYFLPSLDLGIKDAHPYVSGSPSLLETLKQGLLSGWFDIDHLSNTIATYIPYFRTRSELSSATTSASTSINSSTTSWNSVEDVLRDGAIAMCVDYRNFPQGTACDMLTDVCSAITWAISAAPSYGGDPNQVYVLGQSAGAHLILLAALECARNVRDDMEVGMNSRKVEVDQKRVSNLFPMPTSTSALPQQTLIRSSDIRVAAQTPTAFSKGKAKRGNLFAPLCALDERSATPTSHLRSLQSSSLFAPIPNLPACPEEAAALSKPKSRRRAISSTPLPIHRARAQSSESARQMPQRKKSAAVVFNQNMIEERFRALPSSWILRIRGLVALSGPCDLIRAERVFSGRGLDSTLLHAIMNVPQSKDLELLSPVHIVRDMLQKKRQQPNSSQVALPLPPIWLLHGTADKTCDPLGSFELGALLNELGHSAWVDIFHGATHTDLLLEYPALGLELLTLHTHDIIRAVNSEQNHSRPNDMHIPEPGQSQAEPQPTAESSTSLLSQPISGTTAVVPIVRVLSGSAAVKRYQVSKSSALASVLAATLPPTPPLLVVPSPLASTERTEHKAVGSQLDQHALADEIIETIHSSQEHQSTQLTSKLSKGNLLRSPSLSSMFLASPRTSAMNVPLSQHLSDLKLMNHASSQLQPVSEHVLLDTLIEPASSDNSLVETSSTALPANQDEAGILALWPWTQAGAKALEEYAALLRSRGTLLESEMATASVDISRAILEAPFVRHVDTAVAARTRAQSRWPLISRRLVRLARAINPF